ISSVMPISLHAERTDVADNRKIKSLESDLFKAYQKWESLFNRLNEDIAYAGYASEDNPKGNLNDSEWRKYLEQIKVVRDCFGNLGMALYYLAELQKKAKPVYKRP